jgi:hypothetical protein
MYNEEDERKNEINYPTLFPSSGDPYREIEEEQERRERKAREKEMAKRLERLENSQRLHNLTSLATNVTLLDDLARRRAVEYVLWKQAKLAPAIKMMTSGNLEEAKKGLELFEKIKREIEEAEREAIRKDPVRKIAIVGVVIFELWIIFVTIMALIDIWK